jgi:hypothetical protein
VKAKPGPTFKITLLAALVLIAASAFASDKGSLELQHPTSIAGKQLATGRYTVRWDGTGDAVQLKIYQGKNQVASTSARVVKIEAPLRDDSAVLNTNSDGSYSLFQIRFGGKKYALEITNDAAAGGAGASR